MVDIHSHALPFVDDGAKSMSDALAMIERAIACGVTDLFLTPHYRPYQDFLATPQRIRDLFAKVVSQVQNRNLNIRLHLGNEIFYSIEVIDLLRKDKVLKMGNSDMVLIEFATGDDHETIIEAVHNLFPQTRTAAHVERYGKLRNHEYYSGLKRMGADPSQRGCSRTLWEVTACAYARL